MALTTLDDEQMSLLSEKIQKLVLLHETAKKINAESYQYDWQQLDKLIWDSVLQYQTIINAHEMINGNWVDAELHLKETRQNYIDIGTPGLPALAFVITPLIKRFESGERTPELHEAIMSLS